MPTGKPASSCSITLLVKSSIPSTPPPPVLRVAHRRRPTRSQHPLPPRAPRSSTRISHTRLLQRVHTNTPAPRPVTPTPHCVSPSELPLCPPGPTSLARRGVAAAAAALVGHRKRMRLLGWRGAGARWHRGRAGVARGPELAHVKREKLSIQYWPPRRLAPAGPRSRAATASGCLELHHTTSSLAPLHVGVIALVRPSPWSPNKSCSYPSPAPAASCESASPSSSPTMRSCWNTHGMRDSMPGGRRRRSRPAVVRICFHESAKGSWSGE